MTHGALDAREPTREPGEADAAATRAPALTPLERDVLDFEAAHPRHTTAKADAIRARFGRSTAQYYQILATLVEAPAALAHDPLLLSRLRRLRDARAAERDERRGQRRASAVAARRAPRQTQSALVNAEGAGGPGGPVGAVALRQARERT